MEPYDRARALGYPYAAPLGDCIWVDGRVEPLGGGGVNTVASALEDAGANPRAKRTPVLAIGSNRAPAQLSRKFDDFPSPCAVVVARAHLQDFDVVYGAGIAGYGAIGGATLAPSPGTTVEVWATWLDDKQLARMHETEGLSAGVYGLLELQQINLRFDSGAEWTTALAYVQRHGSLNLGGQPTALQEIPALNRNFQALSQRQLQLILRDRFAPAASLDRFIQENLENPSIRQARAKALRETAISFDWPHIQDRTPISLWRG
ncbi:MAG: hypothetical protein ACKVH0_15535 [Alphaproteobacteria bacterium]|jgi:hypothetical protein